MDACIWPRRLARRTAPWVSVLGALSILSPAQADGQDSIPWPAANHLRVAVRARVVAVVRDTVTLEYTVLNDAASAQPAAQFVVRAFMPWYALRAPPLWGSSPGMVQDSAAAHWFAMASEALVLPGHALAGFRFAAPGLLGIVPYRVQGDYEAPEVEEADARVVQRPPSFWVNSVGGVTVGLVPPPEDAGAQSLLVRLKMLTDRACSLGWIPGRGICRELAEHLDQASRELRRGRREEVRQHLREFERDLRERSGRRPGEEERGDDERGNRGDRDEKRRPSTAVPTGSSRSTRSTCWRISVSQAVAAERVVDPDADHCWRAAPAPGRRVGSGTAGHEPVSRGPCAAGADARGHDHGAVRRPEFPGQRRGTLEFHGGRPLRPAPSAASAAERPVEDLRAGARSLRGQVDRNWHPHRPRGADSASRILGARLARDRHILGRRLLPGSQLRASGRRHLAPRDPAAGACGQRAVVGQTVGVAPFPTDLSPGNLLARLQALADSACRLGWIQGRGTCRELATHLDQANRELQRGRREEARQHLREFVRDLRERSGRRPGEGERGDDERGDREDRGAAVNSSAYWLLTVNAEYSLTHLCEPGGACREGR